MQTLFRITIQLLFLGLGITDAVAQPGQAYFDPPAGYKPEFRRERNHELIREEQRLIMESDGVKDSRFTPGESEPLNSALTQAFNVDIESIDTQIVGPSWGEEITKKALYGLFAFLIVIMIFLAMIFEPKMAIAAIVAVVHDVFITVGIYALVGFDVTPATIIGF